jgi:hypothetical protein
MNYLRPRLADERVGFVSLDRQQSEGGRLDRDGPRRLLFALRRRAAAASGRVVLGQAREGGEKARGASVEGIAHGQCSVTGEARRASGWVLTWPTVPTELVGESQQSPLGQASPQAATEASLVCNPAVFLLLPYALAIVESVSPCLAL